MRPPGPPTARVVVAIDVKPRLLSSALARVLRADGLVVVVLDDGGVGVGITERYDIVVTSRPAPKVDAALVVRVLDPAAELPPGRESEGHAEDGALDLDRLAAVLDRIDRWRVGRTVHRPTV